MTDDVGMVDVTRGVDLEISFEGDPGAVRSFDYGDEFGLIVKDIDIRESQRLLARASVAADEQSLRQMLVELADAGCNQSEIADYLAVQAGIDIDEWADLTDGSAHTVEQNDQRARRKIDSE